MESSQPNSPITLICHPFSFALKEGLSINDDMLDYSLMLLQRTCTEFIKSPSSQPHKKMVFVEPLSLNVGKHKT